MFKGLKPQTLIQSLYRELTKQFMEGQQERVCYATYSLTKRSTSTRTRSRLKNVTAKVWDTRLRYRINIGCCLIKRKRTRHDGSTPISDSHAEIYSEKLAKANTVAFPSLPTLPPIQIFIPLRSHSETRLLMRMWCPLSRPHGCSHSPVCRSRIETMPNKASNSSRLPSSSAGEHPW